MNKLGKFYVTSSMMYDPSMSEVLREMEFVPLRVEHLAYANMFELIGLSPIFAALDEGYTVPIYTLKLLAYYEDNGNRRLDILAELGEAPLCL